MAHRYSPYLEEGAVAPPESAGGRWGPCRQAWGGSSDHEAGGCLLPLPSCLALFMRIAAPRHLAPPAHVPAPHLAPPAHVPAPHLAPPAHVPAPPQTPPAHVPTHPLAPPAHVPIPHLAPPYTSVSTVVNNNAFKSSSVALLPPWGVGACRAWVREGAGLECSHATLT